MFRAVEVSRITLINTISVGDDPRNHTTGFIPDPIQSSHEPERSGIFVFGLRLRRSFYLLQSSHK